MPMMMVELKQMQPHYDLPMWLTDRCSCYCKSQHKPTSKIRNHPRKVLRTKSYQQTTRPTQISHNQSILVVPNQYNTILNTTNNHPKNQYHLCCSDESDRDPESHPNSIMENRMRSSFILSKCSNHNVISKLFLLLIFTIVITAAHAEPVRCPHVNLIHRLTAPNGAPVNRYSPQVLNQTPECDCTILQEDGWEITCYANGDEDSEDSYKSNNAATTSDSSKLIDEFESSDYGMMDYTGEIHVSFTVQYQIGRKLTLTCIKGAPAFKPALFQGFGIDSIDTFFISNCELPQTLPLSVILYRTQTHGFALTSTMGTHSFAINTTGQAQDIISPIRALVIQSRKPVSIKQLNTLLSDLESLEELKLIDFNLNDIDSYGSEVLDNNHHHHSSNFNKRNAKHRIKRNEATNSSFVMETTTLPPSAINEFMSETTTISSLDTTKFGVDQNSNHSSPFVSLTTVTTYPPPTSAINLKVSNEDNIMKNGTASFDLDVENEPPTTTSLPMTTVAGLSDSNIINIIQPEDMINTTTNSHDENDASIIKDLGEDNFNDNDVNLENKPIFVFDENVLNFARILPNLRILILEEFVKESTISNVLLQIIKGLEKLEELRLTSNSLDSIPKDSFSYAGSKLKRLYLHRNSIKSIDENAFNNLTQLEILDISNNELSHLSDYTFKPLKNLQFLKMHTNRFQNLSEYLFQANPKLVSLDLSQNNQLEPLPSNLFHGLSSLSNLSLAECNLTDVSRDTRQFFRNVPNLTNLNLKKNQLSNLTLNGLFSWNSKLSKLDLSFNRIEDINANIFNTNSSRLLEMNLNRNRLVELPENLFQNARSIRKLSVSGNRLRETSPMTFILLRMLEELDLSHNQISTLNTQTNQLPFGIGGSLRIVDLSYNNLTDFETEINYINWRLYVSIGELNLKNNNFSGILTVPSFMGSKEPTVHLDVSSNHFNTVDVFHMLDFMSYKPDELQTPTTLETLVRLDNNPFNCDCFLFPFLNYTKSVGRLYNKNYPHGTLQIDRKILFLIDSTDRIICHSPDHLRNHPLSSLKLNELICEIDDHRVCPQQCDCQYRSHDRSATIDCDNRGLMAIPEEMNLSQFFNISLKDTSLKIPRVNSATFQLRSNQIEQIESLTPMIVWNKDERLKPSFVEILLDKNNITNLEDNLIAVPNIDQAVVIKKFSLQNNNLQKIPMQVMQDFDLISNMRNSKISNKSSTNTVNRYKPIKSKIYIGNNPIDCYNEPSPPGSECYIRDFKLWLSSHPQLVGDVNSVQCDKTNIDMQRVLDANSSLVIVNMSDDLLCPMLIPPTSNTTLMALSIICVVLASSLFVVSILYYRNKQTILAFIYIHLNPIFICLSFTEEDLDEEKIYDAFVSYSSSDRDIVMELIEKLEKPYDMNEVSLILQNGLSIHEGKADQIVPENVFKKSLSLKSTATKNDLDVENGSQAENTYRLCIHERDWLPGNLISWNIVNSVQNSRRTILILSQSFIQSIWFQIEFHTAYYQMLEDKMDRLIVIVRGELPPKDQLDKDLNFLLTTKTYLVWGEKWFWEKLYYAMPHKKNRQPMIKEKSEKDKLTSAISSNPKYNGGLNGRLNGVNDGMLKWSQNNRSKPNSKAEAMIEYADKTIESHFQLNSYSSPKSNSPAESSTNNSKPSNGISNNNNNNNKPQPKSLRNSGTLATATPNTLKAFNYHPSNNGSSSGSPGGIDNKSFIDETNT